MADETFDLDALLVEDNPGDARLIEHHLDSPSVAHFVEDVTVTHVESLATAIEQLDTEAFDVVLLDLGLKESTGLETLDRAREHVETAPIIVLTGIDDRETAMEAIERGAQDYLPKGEADGDRLVRALRYAVVRSRHQRQLRRQNEQMDFFNSVLRHDILNGMNVIQSRGELLAEDLDGESEVWAETIVDWSDNITDLTRKVRSTLTTLTDGESADLTPQELHPTVRSEAQRVRQMDQDVSVSIECPDGATVLADELLGDVLGNILTNAVDHGGESVDVAISVTDEHNRYRIEIADDGRGISPEDRERVFERGEQGQDSAGSGFGLYFVDAMVASYDGDVWVEESDRGGARFVVELLETTTGQSSH